MQNILLVILIFLTSTIYTIVGDKNDRTDENGLRNSKNGVILIDTSLGSVAGLQNVLVNSFLGIPFAQPPINALRFRPPKTKRPWYPEVIQAFKFGPECLQSSATGGGGEEFENAK